MSLISTEIIGHSKVGSYPLLGFTSEPSARRAHVTTAVKYVSHRDLERFEFTW